MDNRASVGAGLSIHGLRRFRIESADMEKEDRMLSTAWPSSWKAGAASCVAPPRFLDNEDGDDYMSGLAEEISQCMLEGNNDGSTARDGIAYKTSESPWGAQGFLSTSPQSTLAGMSTWDLLSPGASSTGGLSSGVSSPPTPVASAHVRNEEDDALDLLYAELLRLKMEDEIKARQQQLIQLKQQQHYQQLLWKMRQRQAASLSYEAVDALKFVQDSVQFANCSSTQKAPGSATLFYKGLPKSDEPYQVRVRKPMNTLGGHQSQRARQRSWSAAEPSNQGHPHFAAYACNGSQHKAVNGSGMRAVFLGTPGARELGGTGVFLPRRLGSGHDTKRKPACSTVLLPSRIVQALNLNVEDTLVPNSSSPASIFLRRDSLPARSRSSPVSAEVMDPREDWLAEPAVAPSPLQEVAPDICLPTEWTY